MNSAKDYSTIEELDDYFSRKVSLIKECLVLKDVDDQSLTFFRDFENSMLGLRKVFQDIRIELNEGHEQLKEMKVCNFIYYIINICSEIIFIIFKDFYNF